MPYAYASRDDITRYHDIRVLVQLTVDDDTVDFNNNANLDESVLMSFENSSAKTIDNHLRNVYTSLPLTGDDLTQEVVQMCADLTWCNLWRRRGEEPEQVSELRKEIMDRLKAMSKIDSDEIRGTRDPSTRPSRSRIGKARTVFDGSGYFDGLSFPGRRTMKGDSENAP